MTDVQYESIVKFVSAVWGAYAAFWGAVWVIAKVVREIRLAEIAASIVVARERSEGDAMARRHESEIKELQQDIAGLAKMQRDQLIEVLGELKR